jgi:hypothetical protein
LTKKTIPPRMPFHCGNNSVVECQLPKLKVAGSNPVSRSKKYRALILNGIRAFLFIVFPMADLAFSAVAGSLKDKYRVQSCLVR